MQQEIAIRLSPLQTQLLNRPKGVTEIMNYTGKCRSQFGYPKEQSNIIRAGYRKKKNAIALVVIKGLEIPYLRSFLTRQTKLRCPHAVMSHSHPHDIRAK